MFSSEQMKKSLENIKQCAQDLTNQGIDLEGYTMLEVIDDMEAARKLLGYNKIHLLSQSYGTRLAQIYAHRYP